MIRKGVIAVLMLAAVSTVLWLESKRLPRTWTWDAPLTVRWTFDNYLGSTMKRIHLVDGRIYIKHFELIDRYSKLFELVKKYSSPNTLTVGFAGFKWSMKISRPNPPPINKRPNFVAQELRQLTHLLTKRLWRLELCIPLWMPFILFVTYPTIAFIRGPLRRYRRRRRGLCVKCGYNLTGNTTGVCSECGAEIVL